MDRRCGLVVFVAVLLSCIVISGCGGGNSSTTPTGLLKTTVTTLASGKVGTPYYVLLTRANRRPRSEVWPIQLDQPLPDIIIPLLAGDRDIVHHLQSTFTATYDKSAFGVLIDYNQPPDIKLPPDELAYARRVTRS